MEVRWEKEDGKLLKKCVEELKKKGVKFDLLKEVEVFRRGKSMRVEDKAVKKWSARDLVTLFFVARLVYLQCYLRMLTGILDKTKPAVFMTAASFPSSPSPSPLLSGCEADIVSASISFPRAERRWKEEKRE
ncbi:hypothetical protein ACLOJK_038147 [Asimina triloba]